MLVLLLAIFSVVFMIYIVVSLWYINKLNARLRAYEDVWNHIENISDHNRDGEVIISVRSLGDNDDS